MFQNIKDKRNPKDQSFSFQIKGNNMGNKYLIDIRLLISNRKYKKKKNNFKPRFIKIKCDSITIKYESKIKILFIW